MPNIRFASAPHMQQHVIGREQQQVIVIDGVMQDARPLVDFAMSNAGFTKAMAGLYPGMRAPLPLAYVRALVALLDPMIRQNWMLAAVKLVKVDCVYSLVTNAPAELVPFQRIPHIDTTDPLHFAALHFLCGAPFGGTAFYRQEATGFETVTPGREGRYESARDAFLPNDHSLPRYMADDDFGYERIAMLDARFDRLLVYRSNALHSGHIPDAQMLTDDPATGRLTANIFLGYRSL